MTRRFLTITAPALVDTFFQRARANIVGDLRATLSAAKLDPKSIEAGHKIIAARSTVLSRIHAALQNLHNNPLEGKESTNELYLRFTNHPTEGQNLRAIKEKDAIVNLQKNLIQAQKNEKVSAENLVVLARIAKNLGIETHFIEEAKKSGLPSVKEFEEISNLVQKQILQSFVENPIHHVKKMTVADEREMLLYHLDRCRKDSADLVRRFPRAVKMENIRLSTWAGDMDGKPHIQPSHGVIFEHESQTKFFDSLAKMLEDVADEIDLDGKDGNFLRQTILKKIREIQKKSADKILIGDEAKNCEKEIISAFEEFEKSHPELLTTSFHTAKNYVTNSSCKTAENGFTTREEIGNTLKAFAEIAEICSSENPELRKKFGGEIDPKKLAENFDSFSDATKRQVICALEAMSMHSKHEHIISQFDCEKSSYVTAIAFFAAVKNSAKYLKDSEFLRKYYGEKSKETGFDLHAQIFSAATLENIEKAVVELSPLAEEKKTIERLVEFTAAMLADPEILDHLKKSGGVVRQTRSNSDGSASFGAQAVSIRYLEADIAIQKMVEEAGLKLEILSGIGANDIDRMAPLTTSLMETAYTVQGGDAQHVTSFRLSSLLTKDPRNRSQEALISLKEKYADRLDEFESLLDFYQHEHLASEEGFEIELEGKKVKSAHLSHRGPIPGTVVQYLGNLSSRPDSRIGNVSGGGFLLNSFANWHQSVYNPTMRRIGAISLQRASGMSTFLMAPFYHAAEADPELLHDFNQIPAIRNTNLAAIFALGTADPKSFLLANGVFDLGMTDDDLQIVIRNTAKNYENFLKITDEEERKNYAAKNNLTAADDIRAGHLCYQLEGTKNVLRNALVPLIEKSSPEIRDDLEKIFQRAEANGSLKNYHREVIAACEILTHDETLDLETKKTLACIAQQIANVRREGNFFDTRADQIKKAHDALESGDRKGFETACEWLAIIMRSAGNPVSPGRKTEELFPYFSGAGNFETAVSMEHLLREKSPELRFKPHECDALRGAAVWIDRR